MMYRYPVIRDILTQTSEKSGKGTCKFQELFWHSLTICVNLLKNVPKCAILRYRDMVVKLSRGLKEIFLFQMFLQHITSNPKFLKAQGKLVVKCRPLVSVIVPVYNVDAYIEKAVDSIIKQTLQGIEIILVDDGSNDESLNICRSFAKKDKRISFIRNLHQGVSVTRNKGLEIASGKYISFIDADDWIDENMLEYLYSLAEKFRAEIAVCSIKKEYPNGKSREEVSPKTFRLDWITAINEVNYNGKMSAYLWNKLFLKELIDGIWFEEGVTIGEDYSFLMKVLQKRPSIICGNASTYHYRQRENSVSYAGFQNRTFVEKNRLNYKMTYEDLAESDAKVKDSALAYYILQEMAVVISMVKSGCYDKMVCISVQKHVKKYLFRYLRIWRVPLYLKGCALLLCIHEKLLLVPYKLFFDPIRRAGGI